MAKVVKSKLRRNAKVVEDATQKKLSIYFKKSDGPTASTNLVKPSNNNITKYFSLSRTESNTESSRTKPKRESLEIEEKFEYSNVNAKTENSTIEEKCESSNIESEFSEIKEGSKTSTVETKTEPSGDGDKIASQIPCMKTVNISEELEDDDSDVTEIPPTPVTDSYCVNTSVSSIFRLKRSLFDKTTSISQGSSKGTKHKSKEYLTNGNKKLKLSKNLLNYSKNKNDKFTQLQRDLNLLCRARNVHSDGSVICQENKQCEVIEANQENEAKLCSFRDDRLSEPVRAAHSVEYLKTFDKTTPFTDITPKASPLNVLQTNNSPQKPNYTLLRTPPKRSLFKKNISVGIVENDTELQTENVEPLLCASNIENKNDFDWDEDLGLDFDSDFSITPKKCQNSKTSVPKIVSSSFKVESIQKQSDGVHLTLLSLSDSYKRCCILKGFWQDTLVDIGDQVSVISAFDTSGVCVVDNDNGFFIVNDDILVSNTAITSTMFCKRKSVLAERFRGWDSGNQTMFIGNVVHDLFQRVIQKEPKCLDDLKTELSNILQSTPYLHELYGLGLTETSLKNQTLLYLHSTLQWINQYQSVSPSPLFEDTNGSFDEVSACTVRDIEDNIWCTKYGIKGKVDVTVEVTLHKRKKRIDKTMPLELKTGKCSFSDEHKGQVILYSMMMRDRLENADGGLLLYLSEGPKMKLIETSHSKERGLIQLRNELAYYFKHLRKESSNTCVLPEPINRSKLCEKCNFLLPCSLLETVFETKSSCNKQRSELTKETTRHLTSEHKVYFSKWYEMLQKEFQSQSKKGTAFWTESAKAKENGRAFLSNLQLKGLSSEKIGNRFSHIFYEDDRSELANVGLSVGDFVLVSSLTKSQICITMGTITLLSASTITALLEKDLYKRKKLGSHTERFRLDLNYSTTPFDTSFRNLLKLMQNNHDSERLRSCVIDKVKPVFKKGLRRDLGEKIKPYLKTLNVAQQRAVLKLLMAENYILLHGMPGTGKTATIVALVQVLVALGSTVLLTSYTNSAVDNVLLRLSKCDCKFVRLGQASKIHPEVKIYSSDYLTQKITSVKELSEFYNSIPVVAATCLGMNHPMFKQRSFDYCIVDEASQILQTACIGPLYYCKKFVLVGDSKQLPPVTNSKAAREMGFCESLFTRLESPTCTFELNIQYRMNSEIMKLANELTYSGKLVCGSDDVAAATLQIDPNHVTSFKDWRKPVFSCELLHSVVFLDTDDISSSAEVSDSSSVSNPTEIELVHYLIPQLTDLGIKANDIGVISFYKKQVQLLQEKLRTLNVEVNTVDQYQGRDKSVIIVSCVRNNQGSASSEILSDERRLNVAITRARHKLIIIGSLKTLRKYVPFAKLLDLLRANQILSVKHYCF